MPPLGIIYLEKSDSRFLECFGILIWNEYEFVFWLFSNFLLKQTSKGQMSLKYTLFFLKRHFREIGSPVANFGPRIFSFGRIPPNMALNEIYFVFREILFFVDFFWQKWFLNVRFFVTFVRQIFRRDPPTYFFFIFSSKLWIKTKKMKSQKDPGLIFWKIFF